MSDGNTPPSKTCTIENCGRVHYAHGWCESHYARWRRHGDPLAGWRPLKSKGEPERYLREVVFSYDGDECLAWPYACNSAGYGHLVIDGRDTLVSRRVCEEEHGPPPTPNHEAAHSCGRGHEACCAKRHLSWKTRAGNHADKRIHGTHMLGTRCPGTKLTEPAVLQIWSMKGKLSQTKIADLFSVSRGAIKSIHEKKAWKWLTDGSQQ